MSCVLGFVLQEASQYLHHMPEVFLRIRGDVHIVPGDHTAACSQKCGWPMRHSFSFKISLPNICMSTSSGCAYASTLEQTRSLERVAADVLFKDPVAESRYRAPASWNVDPTPAVDQGDLRALNSQPESIVMPQSP